MPKSKEEMILFNSDEAASYKTGISGWVGRHGRFCGKDENMARYSGCTHVLCKGCGKPVKKGWLKCSDCRLLDTIKKYNKMERKEWDGKIPLYSDAADKYFFDADELDCHLEEFECDTKDLRLIICKPVHLRQVDEDYFCDDLPEDGELPEDVWGALEELNQTIKEQGPVGWEPGKYAAII